MSINVARTLLVEGGPTRLRQVQAHGQQCAGALHTAKGEVRLAARRTSTQERKETCRDGAWQQRPPSPAHLSLTVLWEIAPLRGQEGP